MEKILFFDGICAMCNNLVIFVLRHDKKQQIKFATLQGQTAATRLPTEINKNLNTVVYLDHRGLHTESTAILRLIASLGGIWSLAYSFIIVPRFIRNRIYRFIAHHRYHWFGTTESCRLLSPQEKERVLD